MTWNDRWETKLFLGGQGTAWDAKPSVAKKDLLSESLE